MKILYSVYFLLPFIFCSKGSAQKTETIKIRKELVYFFQKGKKQDTILDHSLFYFIVPDSLKKSISIYSDNGQFVTTKNDSLVQLNYIPGLKYESLYEAREVAAVPGKSKWNNKKQNLELKTLVNGTSSNKRDQVFIRIVNKSEDQVLLENTYYYLEGK